ncbi:MAG: hypothetical protein KJN77_04415 [Gammaproteobacteria bacterium]|nr:hypothetical protein [Gammaproteobacteria bacterium]
MNSNQTETQVGSKTGVRRSWLALYAALLSSIVLADPADSRPTTRPAAVSPVSIDTEAAALDVPSVVRRFDI